MAIVELSFCRRRMLRKHNAVVRLNQTAYQFKQGTHSTTLKGKVKGDEEAEYTFGASGGQTSRSMLCPFLLIRSLSKSKRRAERIFDLKSSGTKWTAALPETGDYFVIVKLAPGCTSRAAYTLTFSIQ